MPTVVMFGFLMFVCSLGLVLLLLLVCQVFRLADIQEKRLRVQIDNNSRMAPALQDMAQSVTAAMGRPAAPEKN